MTQNWAKSPSHLESKESKTATAQPDLQRAFLAQKDLRHHQSALYHRSTKLASVETPTTPDFSDLEPLVLQIVNGKLRSRIRTYSKSKSKVLYPALVRQYLLDAICELLMPS